jgi:hypothetical protein
VAARILESLLVSVRGEVGVVGVVGVGVHGGIVPVVGGVVKKDSTRIPFSEPRLPHLRAGGERARGHKAPGDDPAHPRIVQHGLCGDGVQPLKLGGVEGVVGFRLVGVGHGGSIRHRGRTVKTFLKFFPQR